MQQQEVNKMNSSNLAIVFWPTLMRPPIADLADLSKQIDWQLMMTRIIDNPNISCDPSWYYVFLLLFVFVILSK